MSKVKKTSASKPVKKRIKKGTSKKRSEPKRPETIQDLVETTLVQVPGFKFDWRDYPEEELDD